MVRQTKAVSLKRPTGGLGESNKNGLRLRGVCACVCVCVWFTYGRRVTHYTHFIHTSHSQKCVSSVSSPSSSSSFSFFCFCCHEIRFETNLLLFSILRRKDAMESRKQNSYTFQLCVLCICSTRSWNHFNCEEISFEYRVCAVCGFSFFGGRMAAPRSKCSQIII